MAEIREEKDISDEGQLTLYEAYVRDFPEDDEAYYIYGQLLKKNNQKDKASAVFRKLYTQSRLSFRCCTQRTERRSDHNC